MKLGVVSTPTCCDIDELKHSDSHQAVGPSTKDFPGIWQWAIRCPFPDCRSRTLAEKLANTLLEIHRPTRCTCPYSESGSLHQGGSEPAPENRTKCFAPILQYPYLCARRYYSHSSANYLDLSDSRASESLTACNPHLPMVKRIRYRSHRACVLLLR